MLTAGLDDAQATALLVGALERPSPSGDEGAVAAFLRDALLRFAPDARVDAVGNAVASVGHGPRRVTMLGHIDTVAGWWPVRHADGVIHGRGAVDAKGPFCAMIVAASRLSAAAKEGLTVRLVGAVEEEAPTSRGARHAVASEEPPDLVVIGEPSGWDALTLGYKGRLVVRIEARRPLAHSARDELTAPEVVVSAWHAVNAWARGTATEVPGVFDAVQASLLELGSGGDGLQVWAHAVVGLRLPLACPPETAHARVRNAIQAVALPEGAGLTVSVGANERAHRGPRDTALTRAFRTAIRRRGGTPRLTLKTGTSDMNVVAPHWSVPMLAYGPGDAALDHTPDEHVGVAEYLRAIDVLVDALETLAAARDGGASEGTQTSQPRREPTAGTT